MSTVTTSIERPLTEPELAELRKQQARLLQDIGELVAHLGHAAPISLESRARAPVAPPPEGYGA